MTNPIIAVILGSLFLCFAIVFAIVAYSFLYPIVIVFYEKAEALGKRIANRLKSKNDD